MSTTTILACSRMARLSAIIALAFTAGCSSETGILIEVSQAELSGEPDSLRFFVGVQYDELGLDIPGCGQAVRFSGDAEADRDVSIGGRDLASDPYKLLLSPSDTLSREHELMVVAVALRGEGEVVGIGALEKPVMFVDGKVLSWPITLSRVDDTAANVTEAGCACARTSIGMIAITPTADPDCDTDIGDRDCDHNNPYVGMSSPERCGSGIDDNCDGVDDDEDKDEDGFTPCEGDCDDDDRTVHPGAVELCDGLDNDCSASTPRYPESSECYVGDADGICFMGKAYCDDYNPNNTSARGVCEALDGALHNEASPESCIEYAQCLDSGSPPYYGAECSDGEVFDDVECTLSMTLDEINNVYVPCPGAIFLGAGLPEQAECYWVLMGGPDQGDYKARLRRFVNNTGDTAVIDSCRARLSIYDVLTVPPEFPGESVFRVWSSYEGFANEHLRITVHSRVLPRNDECPQLGGLDCGGNLPILPPFDTP